MQGKKIKAINQLGERVVYVSKADAEIKWLSDLFGSPCEYFLETSDGTLLLSLSDIDKDEIPYGHHYGYYEIDRKLYDGAWTSKYEKIVKKYNERFGKIKMEQMKLF